MKVRVRRPLANIAAAVVAATAALYAPALAEAAGPVAADLKSAGAVAPAVRDKVLGSGWRSSGDRAWTTASDADGFHILVADSAKGYAWRDAATLAEPGFATDRWVGNACITGSGRRVVAVYAPRNFTNHAELSGRGGFTAVVDLDTGAVTRLPVTTSLAYFNPGCGTDENVALTQEGDENLPKTRLLKLDAGRATLAKAVELTGQATSAVPAGAGFFAARGNGIAEITADGRSRERIRTTAVPFGLTVDGAGGVSYLEQTTAGMAARRLAGGRGALLAEGRLGAFGLARGSAGRVFLTGTPTAVRPLPAQVSRVAADPQADLSTQGRMAVQQELAAVDVFPSDTRPVTRKSLRLAARVPATGASVPFTVAPGTPAPVNAEPAEAASAKAGSPNAVAPKAAARVAAASPSEPVETEAYCSVPRNDIHTMAYQPRNRQIEWAVDYAIFNGLTTVRPAGYRNFGLGSYSPQELYPSRPLYGGGHVAAQIMLGILAQETNLWQASQADSGEYGSPLIGNYYGQHYYDADTSDDWQIHWADSDCGYGIGQVTDGMRKAGHEKPGEVARSTFRQRAIALDYAVNIAAGLQILQEKWNATMEDGLVINNGDPTRIENWFFAAWAYNSGYHPYEGAGKPWGMGWGNNPINPRYDPTRHMFLDVAHPEVYGDNAPTMRDASHPQDWPYQEKVMGWAAQSIDTVDGTGFRIASWNATKDGIEGEIGARLRRSAAKPDPKLFCTAANTCDPDLAVQPNEPGMENEKPGPCLHKNDAGQYDLKCWIHESVVWKADCAASCGFEGIRYDLSGNYAEPADATHYPPPCTPNPAFIAGTVIVDDVPSGTVTPRCGKTNFPRGSFSLDFAGVAADQLTSKIEFQQLDSGFAGHNWFARARYGGAWRVTGTWKSPVEMNGTIGVWVYIPAHGARTTRAIYHIRSLDGRIRQATVDQTANAGKWVNLGRYQTDAGLTVNLENTRSPSDGSSVGYDAVAFVPLPA
ncbi:hypothetical protein AB0C29_35575 [Actinoplanes sp. NPDC048791]|uniref:golvesin C-terminal-like domain-containing protein n=1 Tax=Actinoplanes sp. NPDC048791 TaxID=3154623 RepID=UPI0033CDE4EA